MAVICSTRMTSHLRTYHQRPTRTLALESCRSLHLISYVARHMSSFFSHVASHFGFLYISSFFFPERGMPRSGHAIWGTQYEHRSCNHPAWCRPPRSNHRADSIRFRDQTAVQSHRQETNIIDKLQASRQSIDATSSIIRHTSDTNIAPILCLCGNLIPHQKIRRDVDRDTSVINTYNPVPMPTRETRKHEWSTYLLPVPSHYLGKLPTRQATGHMESISWTSHAIHRPKSPNNPTFRSSSLRIHKL